MKIIYQLKVGDFAPSESSRSFTKEGYLKCVNVRLAKAPQVRQYQAYTTAPSWTGTALTTTIGGLQATTPYYIRVAARDVWKETIWNYSNQITQSTSEA